MFYSQFALENVVVELEDELCPRLKMKISPYISVNWKEIYLLYPRYMCNSFRKLDDFKAGSFQFVNCEERVRAEITAVCQLACDLSAELGAAPDSQLEAVAEEVRKEMYDISDLQSRIAQRLLVDRSELARHLSG